MFLPKSGETIVADLGILYSGNCYANLDVKSPPERLKGMLQNLETPLIVTTAAHAAAVRAAGVPEAQLLLIEEAMSGRTALTMRRCGETAGGDRHRPALHHPHVRLDRRRPRAWP